MTRSVKSQMKGHGGQWRDPLFQRGILGSMAPQLRLSQKTGSVKPGPVSGEGNLK